MIGPTILRLAGAMARDPRLATLPISPDSFQELFANVLLVRMQNFIPGEIPTASINAEIKLIYGVSLDPSQLALLGSAYIDVIKLADPADITEAVNEARS